MDEHNAELTGLGCAQWRKSTVSGTGNCVEIAFTGRAVSVRDSNAPSRPVISFPPSAWVTFLVRVRHGKFDYAALENSRIQICQR